MMKIVRLSLCFLMMACIPQGYHKINIQLPAYNRREAQLYIPKELKKDERLPLFLFLHGYGTDPDLMDYHLGLGELSAKNRLAYIKATGIKDGHGKIYWNSTGTCCNRTGQQQNDVDYLAEVVKTALEKHPFLDPQKVYILGYSNGAFMSYRLGLERSELFAGMINFAGSNYLNYANQGPRKALRIIHIHGDKDQIIPFNGGKLMDFPEHLPVPQILSQWSEWNGCIKKEKFDHQNCNQNTWIKLIVKPGEGHYLFPSRKEVESYLTSIMAE